MKLVGVILNSIAGVCRRLAPVLRNVDLMDVGKGEGNVIALRRNGRYGILLLCTACTILATTFAVGNHALGVLQTAVCAGVSVLGHIAADFALPAARTCYGCSIPDAATLAWLGRLGRSMRSLRAIRD